MAIVDVSTTYNDAISGAQERLPLAFSKRFLERLDKMNPTPFMKFRDHYPITQSNGYKVIITKPDALSVASTPFTDGAIAAKNQPFTTTTLTLTLGFYGNDIGWTTLFDITSVDVAKETHSKELAMNAKESLTQIQVDQLDLIGLGFNTSPAVFANIILAGRTLLNNKTRGFDELNGQHVGAIGPYMWEDLSKEGGAAYRDHYQTVSGSEIMADGMLTKPAATFQFFITNYCKTTAVTESAYFWGEGALGAVELQASIAGSNGRSLGGEINVPSLLGYLIPARAELSDPYGLMNHAVWRAGPIANAVIDSNRVYVGGTSAA